ncbi:MULTISPECIES: hypothetical protein [Rhizobium]|uniref:hypothetical protein n=1 Tax=Rhizobium TaxID=379 RepID=UPI001C8FE754|nr:MULTISPECIES: hypothetical protein [Rhizobium]MBY2987007.1 hypothetical protein [Rhizobium leguminosarum]MBY3049143.1 hypothetical protein [Rhizobium laguerreae]
MSFEFSAVEHQLEIVDRNSTTFRSEHKYWIKAEKATRFFIRHYVWTGSGVEKEPIPELVTEVDDWGFPHQRIHGPLLCEEASRILIVDLGRMIDEGENEFVHFRHRMKDLKATFKPMLSVQPTKKVKERIVLRIIVPDWTDLVVRYRSFTRDTKKVVVTRTLSPTQSSNGRLTFERTILNPSEKNLGHKLEWSHQER